MAIERKKQNNPDPDRLEIEVLLQRLFHEKNPTAHRVAIWELFHLTGDWELFEKISEFGGERGIAAYFQNIVDYLESPEEAIEEDGAHPAFPMENREQIQELYSSPLSFLRRRDWAGSAAAMHEILLTEIYDVYNISEDELAFEEATALSLKKWVGEEVLFPLSLIEYFAFSDLLMKSMDQLLLENYLSIILTLFFSAQAHLDINESNIRPTIQPGDIA